MPNTVKRIIPGNDLMLFIDNKSVAYATAHTLNISTETADISSKDHGVYGASEVTKINWEITSSNLYTEDEFNMLFDKMTVADSDGAIKPIDVIFSLKNETDNSKTVADGDLANWTPIQTGKQYQGKVYVTSLTANANNGEKATFDCTLSGVGKLVRVEVPGA